MIVRLFRHCPTEKNVGGLLYIDGILYAYTLEDKIRDIKVYGETCIPFGVYELRLVDSPKFTPRYGHKMIELMNVPGFDKIYIHPGNSELDTLGCVLVANCIKSWPDQILADSRIAYDRVYSKIATALLSGEKVAIVIEEFPKGQ